MYRFIEYRTCIGFASTDAMSDSPQHLLTMVLLYWWPNSEAQKTQEYRQTLYGNGSLLKPNSVNAVRLENPGVLFQENINQSCPRIPHYGQKSQNTSFRAWIRPPLKVSCSTAPKIYIHSSLIFVITGFLRILISSGVIRLRETLLSRKCPRMVF